jgi:two-component system, chemotaxis family, response regulator WspF
MKIGIVNDLPMAAEALRRVLLTVPEHQVVWIARDGPEAVELCAKHRPDLVLMDLILPGFDGVEATRRIMARTPCTILIVTASIEVNASRVFDAMGYGALDAVDTPSLGLTNLNASAAPLLAKIGAIARMLGRGPGSQCPAKLGALTTSRHAMVAIGASAGGPTALSTVLAGLPKTFAAAIVIIQHVDARFVAGMAEWLGKRSALPVRLAEEGDRPLPGTVLLAGTGDHLVLKAANRLGYVREPSHYAYRPSVDVYFQSVGKLWPGKTVGILLTGMGDDGARGLKELRSRGHHTIAQDETSSAVYGMPKAAAALDAAVNILPLKRIAPSLVDAFGASIPTGAANHEP